MSIKKFFAWLQRPFQKQPFYIVQLDVHKMIVAQIENKGRKLHLKNIESCNLTRSEITEQSLGNITSLNDQLSFIINKGASRRPKIIASLPFMKTIVDDKKKLVLFQALLALSKHGFALEKVVTQSIINTDSGIKTHSKRDACPTTQSLKAMLNETSNFLLNSYGNARKWLVLTAISVCCSLLYVIASYENVAHESRHLDHTCSNIDNTAMRVQEIAKQTHALKKNKTQLTHAIKKLNTHQDGAKIYHTFIVSLASIMPSNSRLETLSIKPANKKNTKSLLLTITGVTKDPEEINDLIQSLIDIYPNAHIALNNLEPSDHKAEYTFVIKGKVSRDTIKEQLC